MSNPWFKNNARRAYQSGYACFFSDVNAYASFYRHILNIQIFT
ncbi:hypothetical protein GCM10027167_90340 [Nocardia heshunensis]